MLAAIMNSTEGKNLYRTDYSRLKGELAGHGEAWIHEIREAAIARFAELGFPSNRDEEWRYTNVKPIATIPFERARYDIEGLAPDAVGRASLGLLETRKSTRLNSSHSQ